MVSLTRLASLATVALQARLPSPSLAWLVPSADLLSPVTRGRRSHQPAQSLQSGRPLPAKPRAATVAS